MGLSPDFLSMLTATVTLERHTGKDQWGNESFGAPEPHRAFIDSSSAAYGSGEAGGRKENASVSSTQIMMDAVGVRITDRLTFGGTQHSVTAVDTSKDESGADLYQTVTVENQKKG